MRKLLTLSALLLFSVDVFAEDGDIERVCHATETSTYKYGYRLKLAECNHGDILIFIDEAQLSSINLEIIYKRELKISSLIANYCDYEKEIVRGLENFSCVLKYKAPREVTIGDIPFD